MITAYFDDSGTHELSDIVLVAGIFGTQARMDSLDRNWKRYIDSPLCGRKDKVSRYHAYDCDNSIGEFLRWTRTETDYFRLQLRTAIIESGVAAYGIACSRKDYDELIIGDLRGVLGSPEGFCINQCFVRAVGWVQANTFDSQMAMVFDKRTPPVERYTAAVYDAFEKQIHPPPQMVGHAFLSSKAVYPLQAADLIAWELYRYASDILVKGLRTPAPKEVLHLRKNMDFEGQIATRKSIIQVRDLWLDRYKDEPEILKQMAKHFDLFDPANPSYSYLSSK